MIAINAETGFVLYVCLMLVALCGAGIYEVWRERAQHWTVSEEKLGRCEGCNYTFVVPRGEVVVRCPRCETLCASRRRS